MNHLSTYISLISTLLAIFASTISITVAVMILGCTKLLYFALIPIALIIWSISLLIGYFIGQPLRDLHRKIQASLQGSCKLNFEAEGILYEADLLSEDFQDVCLRSSKQQSDLAIREQRQANFIGDVAHELRTPLTAIHGNAEILLDPDLPPSLHDKFCHTIMNESTRLSRLSNDLLTLQHIETDTLPMQLSRLNLRTVAEKVVDSLTYSFEEHHIHVRIDGEAPDVLGNEDRLMEVITNLLENASRFVDEGGHISIRLKGLNNKSLLFVSDDGPGFGDIDPKLLFERFYRADSSRTRGTGGTGLGLSIVKSTIEAHDGTVVAYNLPGSGACFVIALPSLPPEI